jgi:hypothetical protein
LKAPAVISKFRRVNLPPASFQVDMEPAMRIDPFKLRDGTRDNDRLLLVVPGCECVMGHTAGCGEERSSGPSCPGRAIFAALV